MERLPLDQKACNSTPDAIRVEAVSTVGIFKPTSRPEELVDIVMRVSRRTSLNCSKFIKIVERLRIKHKVPMVLLSCHEEFRRYHEGEVLL